MGLQDGVDRYLIQRTMVLNVFEKVTSLFDLNYLAKLFKIQQMFSE